MTEQNIVAKVNGKEITREDVLKFLNDMGPQMAMQFKSPEGIKRIIEEMVNQELVFLDAKDSKLDEEPEFIEALEATKKNLLKGYAFNKIVKDIILTDEEINEYYEVNKDMFKKPEMVSASHILVENEEKANLIKREIEEGKSFEQAAKEHSSCPSKEQGGSLGSFERGRMVAEFEEAAFNLPIGEISQPVKTQFGYHIIKVDDKQQAKDSKLEEIKQQVEQRLMAEKQEKAYADSLNKIKEKYEVEIF